MVAFLSMGNSIPKIYFHLWALSLAALLYLLASLAGWFSWHCPVKYVTGLPCPGCGSTRALSFLFHGALWQSLQANPLGVIVFVGFLLTALLSLRDVILGDWLLLRLKVRFDRFTARNKGIIIGLAFLLMLINWFWNIEKGL